MKIGIAGPASLGLLAKRVNNGEQMPSGYLFAPMAAWIEALLGQDHQVSLFTLAPGITIPQTFKGEQLTIHVGRYRNKHRARDFFRQEQQDLLKAIQENPVDIIHAHWTYEFALASLKSGMPTLVTAHDAPLTILKIYKNGYRFIRFLMAWQVCQHAQVMTAVSPYLEKHFRQVFRFKSPIHIIPNGVPDFVFELAHSKKKCLKNNNKIIFASNLTGWTDLKNGKTLIQAFNQVCLKNPKCELWMYGTGYGNGEAAQIWAAQALLAKNIQFRGQTPYHGLLSDLAENVDVLVHPSLEESFSMAIAEAMALGIPVIGGKNSGAVPDTMGESGMLIDIKSSDALENAMLTLADNPNLRSLLGEKGKGKAVKSYTNREITLQYETIYKQVGNSGE